MEHLKKLLLAGVMAICCFGANAALTNSGVLYVSPSGNDTTARSGQVEFPYKTLTNAFAKLAISNTVVMQPGTYDLGTNRLKLLTGCSLVGAGPTTTIVLSSVLGDNDDIRPTIVLNDNVTVGNFTLRCVTNGNDEANNPEHWQAVGSRVAVGDKAGYTNYYIYNMCFENPMIDCFYIGEDDSQHLYSGVVNNCYIPRFKPAHWDVIAVGGTNSSHTFNNCTFYAGMRNSTEATLATFTRLGGSCKLYMNNCCFEWTNVISNFNGAIPYVPFLIEPGAFAAGSKMYINGGTYIAYRVSGGSDESNGTTNTIGSFSYSTNGGATMKQVVSNGDANFSLSGIGYPIVLSSSANQSPAANTTYYFGVCPLTTLNTTYTTCSAYVPKAGTIKTVWFWVQVGGTAATTGQGVVSSIRVNNSTDVGSQTFDWNQTVTNVASTGLSQAVSAGDTLAWKIVTPAVWTTTPTTCRIYAIVYIE